MRDAMLGIVNLDKPVGPTSHDMVGLLRRLTRSPALTRGCHAGLTRPEDRGVEGESEDAHVAIDVIHRVGPEGKRAG